MAQKLTPHWVDACDGNLCRSLGCETLAGVDPKPV